MSASGSSLSQVYSTMLPRKQLSRSVINRNSCRPFSFCIALTCVSLVAFFVPERPDQLASICEKHNPVIACQVW